MLVTGVVMDADTGEPLIGASVSVKGTQTGTTTDIDGKFEIDADRNAILEISYTGYLTQEVYVDEQTYIDVRLGMDQELLNEVVVVGYGTQRKSHLTGAISKVKNEKLDQIPVARVDEALIGQVSGVNIQMTDPSAGSSPTIRVRGTGSITAGASPLVVVDGVPVGVEFLTNLDMNDVESIEILKDAASAAIYGSRGANGVILITSKIGVEGKTRFSYNTFVGRKEVPYRDGIFQTVDEWTDFVRANNGGELTDRAVYINQLGTTTDWQEVMFDGGTIQSHSFSAMGGSARTKFRVSVNALLDEGVLNTDFFNKYNVKLNLKTKVSDRVEMGLQINPSYSQQRRFPIGIHDALRQSPWLPLYHDANTAQYIDEDNYPGIGVGDYAQERNFDNYDLYGDGGETDISTTSNANSLAKVLERNRREFRLNTYGSAFLKFNITDQLSFRTTLGGDIRNRERRYYQGTLADRRGASRTSSLYSNDVNLHWLSENIFSYDMDKGAHDLNLIAGFTAEKFNGRYAEVTGAGFDFDFIETINAASVISGGTSIEDEAALASFLGRATYAYDNKYLVSLSARTDGSSRFGPNNKFGFFPAASLGWRISQEDFLADNDFISNAKVRVSYGVTGNNAIGDYQYIGLLSTVGAVINGGVVPGFNPLNIANPDLRWEKSIEFNPGIDLELMDGRIAFSADYYNRTSEQLLLDQPVPSVTGFTDATVNIGEVENKGVELELTTRNVSTSDFTWTTSAIFSRNQNTLVDFAGADGLIGTIDSKRPAEWINQVGQPISSYYGYVVEKEIPLEFIKNPLYPINAVSQDIYVKDLNGDGEITTDDRTILGSPYPDFIWSLTNQFNYGGFDLGFMFQGSHGAEVRNMDPQYINNQFSSNQDYTDDFPDADRVRQRIFTDDIIQDASYLALRTLNFGYTLPNTATDRIGVESLRFYFSGQNLFYNMADDYTGFNPEGINAGGDNPLTYGYQRGASPIFRSLSLGLNLNF